MLDALLLARWQFAITTVYHFLFVPLTLGLSIMTAMIQTKYFKTGDPKYKAMTKFWGKLFLINFAMGVATGLVQEFQFGMNWSEYAVTSLVHHWQSKHCLRSSSNQHFWEYGYSDGIACQKVCILPAFGWWLSRPTCLRCGSWLQTHSCSIHKVMCSTMAVWKWIILQRLLATRISSINLPMYLPLG